MKKRSMKVLATLLLGIFALTACGNNATPAPDDPATENQQEVSGDVVVTDVLGREITLTEPVDKIVGTHNPTLNAAVVMGGGDKYIAGFGNKEMSRNLYEAVMNDFDGIPQIGKGSNINFEEITATGAKVVLLPERFADSIGDYENAGLEAIVALPNEESYDSVKETFTILGKVFGDEERADQIIAFLDDRLDKAEKIVAESEDEPKKVLFLGGSSPLSVAPEAMIQNQLIESAGGVNAVEGIDVLGKFADVSIEQIITWDPDIIWYPAYTDYSEEDLLNDPAWADITAIKNGDVYRFPSQVEPWDQPTAALSLGLSWAIHNLHPDLYSLEDVQKDADEFYEFVYGKTFTAEELGLQ